MLMMRHARLWRSSLFPLMLGALVGACEARHPLAPAFSVSSSGAPAAPTNLAATGTSYQQTLLGWQDNATNENGFEVDRSTTGPSGVFSPLASTSTNATSYSDGGLEPSTQYCYKVLAFRITGSNQKSSAFSNTACATTLKPPIPNAPSATNAVPANSHTVDLTWNDNSSDEGGFRVERSVDGGANWAPVATTAINVTSSQDGGRSSEQQVCYRVIAFNAGGDSPASNTDCTTPPSPPSGLSAIGLDGPVINLTWMDNSAIEDGYEVRRSSDGVTFTVIASLPADNTSYSDRAVSQNTTYSYIVGATKDDGFSDFSAVASAQAGKMTLGGIVALGNTMMKFTGSGAFRALLGDSAGGTDDYVLVRNILQHLSGKASGVRILYTDSCDPRTDPDVCYVGGLEYLQPFYDMIASIGTITYADMASVQRADFDVVIADFCSLPNQEYDLLKSYLTSGGPAMVLGDNFCYTDYGSTASLANAVIGDLGVTFLDYELYEYGRLEVAPSDQVGLLTGVSNLGLWRLTPLYITSAFSPVVTWNDNVLYAIREATAASSNVTASTAMRRRTTAASLSNLKLMPAPRAAGLARSLVATLAKGERVTKSH